MTTNKKLQHPTIHLNGSGRAALLEQYTQAANAARALLEALSAASPNGRDYYPQGAAALSQASREHVARIERVSEVLCEIGELMEAVADG